MKKLDLEQLLRDSALAGFIMGVVDVHNKGKINSDDAMEQIKMFCHIFDRIERHQLRPKRGVNNEKT
jgi:hypothetical protein